jgi:hypothetical protein
VLPLTVNACAISTLLLGTTIFPVPFARKSKLVSTDVVSITLLSISIVLFVKLSAIISPVLVISTVVVIPLIVRSLFIITLLLGINIFPVPFARNSKFVLLVVVVIKLSSTNISSNCADALTTKSCDTLTSPITVVVPV